MSKPILQIDIPGWVERSKADPVAYLQRQAAEVTLTAIAMTSPLNEKLVLKGGVLMGLAYDSPRQTSDIDLSAALIVEPGIDEKIHGMMDEAYPKAAATLGYASLVLKTHSIKRQPKKIFDTAEFPALKMKVGFAERNSKQHEAMLAGKATNILDVDISFNEPLQHTQILGLTDGQELLAYSLIDLIAEKYRAMLQQVERNRSRRQDVYDLKLLIERDEIDAEMREKILGSYLIKCRSRHIEPEKTSLETAEIKKRSAAEWDTMELEVGDLPDFEESYQQVANFYKSLPWRKI